jgi:Zn-dependent protease with chaperone function
MSLRPEEPDAGNPPDPMPAEDVDTAPRQPQQWEVPHRSSAPAAPVDVPPGTFVFEREVAEAKPVTRRRATVDLSVAALVLANLPWVAASFITVVMLLWLITALLGVGFLLVPLTWAWVLSGALIFVPAAGPYIAQYLLGLRAPNKSEADQLDAAWRLVARQAGIDPGSYALWIDDHADVNACQPGGRFLSVSRATLHLAPRHQAAALAHELAHQLAGHTWARMLVQWYSAPARWLARSYGAVLRTTRRGGQVAGPVGATVGCLGAVVWLVLGLALVGGLITTPELRPAIAVLPFLPWLSRWAEKRCDRVAADLGFGPDLLDLFRHWQESGRDDGAATGVIGRIFASRPTVAARTQALEAYLEEPVR